MLHHGSPAEDDRQTTTAPDTPSPEKETTHVPDPSGETSPAAAHVGGDRQLPQNAKGQARSGASVEVDRRRGRPAGVARDQVGAAVLGEGKVAAAGEREEEECGRERLKRHRVAMAGRVWIPDTWGQESLLKDWVDCTAVDRALVPSGLVSAREALVEECRRAEPGGGGFWMESSCLSA